MKRCSLCKREFSNEEIVLRSKRRGENTRRGLKLRQAQGMSIGRPRNIDYEEIIRLRSLGMSLSSISGQLRISRGSVQHALRISK